MHISLYHKRDFADRIKIRDLKMRRLHYLGGPAVITGACKSRELSPPRGRRDETKGRAREIWSMRACDIPLLAFKDRGDNVIKSRGSLKELREAPGWHPARKWGLQFKGLKELNAANNLNELEVDFPQEPLVRAHDGWHLDLGLVRPRAEEPEGPLGLSTYIAVR